ncbi:cupin domain-containing protein [candidate division KSB1 bacterium]|nr:cupin domain-containing protein [candidate division KSB1 bacterium]
MDELEKALSIALTGEARAHALQRFQKQMAKWGIALPKAEPFALDFGLGKFESIGLVESWIANEVDAGYCGKYLFVIDGQTCPAHHHLSKHESFFIVQGRVRMVLDGKEFEMKPGDILAIPPQSKHCFTGIGPALLLELSQPCVIEDNYFEDNRIPIGGNYRKRDCSR